LWFQAYYLWARDIGDVDIGGSVENAFNRQRDVGVWSNPPTNRLFGSFIYDLPVGKGKHFLPNAGRWLNSIVGGWQLGTILTLQDGFPLTATCGSGAVQNGGDTCLADATGVNPNLSRGQQDPRRFFLERSLQRLKIRVRKLSCLLFEVQIAQVLIDRFLALLQICQPGLLRTQVQSSGKIEDVEEHTERHHGAGESCDGHISVSFLA